MTGAGQTRLWTAGAAVVAAVTLLGACSAQDYQVVGKDAQLLVAPKTGAAVKDTLLFGQRLKARAVFPWQDRAFLQRMDGPGFVAVAQVAPFPLPATPAVVAVDRASVLAPEGGAPPRGVVTLGEKVDVVMEGPFLPGGRVALVRDGAVRGFLERNVVATTPPDAAALQRALKRMLLVRQLDAADGLAQNAMVLHPEDPVYARLRRELLLRRDETDKAAALDGKAGEPTPLPPVAGAPPVAFSPGYVGVAHAALLQSPKEGATVLAMLRANHPVAVLAVERGHARVNTQVGDIVAVDAFGDGRVTFPGGRQLNGYIPVAQLTSQPMDEENLLTRAQQAAEKGQHPTALVLAARAYAMRPREATANVMLDAAFATGRFDVLLAALFPPNERGEGLRGAQLLLGCAGNLQGATYIHAPQQSDNWVAVRAFGGLKDALTEPGFCLSGVDPRPPCAPRYVPPDCSKSLGEEECLEGPRAAHQARLEEFNASVLPQHQKASAVLERALGNSPHHLALRWTDLLDADVMALLGQRARTNTFTVYALPVRSVALGNCEAGGQLVVDEVDVRTVNLPRMVGTSARHLFVRVPHATGYEYGAALAPPEAVTAWLKQRPHTLRYAGRQDPTGTPVEGQDPAPPFPLFKVRTPPTRDCDQWCVEDGP